MELPKIKNILFLRGVFLSDCIKSETNLKHKNLNKDNKQQSEIKVDIKKLPTTYTGLDQWIKSTNIYCWYCDRQFDTVPYFIPKNIEPTKTGLSMGVEGCFCSVNCGWSYIRYTYPKLNDRLNKESMLQLLDQELSQSKKIRNIAYSPDKTIQIKFGGILNSIEYGNLILEKQKSLDLVD